MWKFVDSWEKENSFSVIMAKPFLNKGMNWHKKHWPNRDILS